MTRLRARAGRVLLYAAALALAAQAVLPLLWMLSTSLKPPREVFATPPTLIPGAPTLENFARLVTDQATFAYLADVFVVAEERNAGLGQWLIESILAYPPLQGLRRWLLVTKDAKALYLRCGFAELCPHLSYLERFDPAVCA